MLEETNAAEVTPAAPLSPLDLLTLFADNSLLARSINVQGYARFSMLSSLHEYALERMNEHEETELLRDWHVCYFLRKVEKGEIDLRGPRQLRALSRLSDSRANLRTALEWALQKARTGQSIRSFSPPRGQPHEVASCHTLSRQTFSAGEMSACGKS